MRHARGQHARGEVPTLSIQLIAGNRFGVILHLVKRGHRDCIRRKPAPNFPACPVLPCQEMLHT
jgi:hypothetical protein